MSRDLDLAPTAAPMRPHRKPRRMREPGRRRTPYVPAPKQTCPHCRRLDDLYAWCCHRREDLFTDDAA